MTETGDELSCFPPGTTVHHTTLRDGLGMRYYARGPADAPTALFIHGFPELAVSWRFQFEGLSARFRCVAPDMRGYGGTDAPRKRSAYALPRLVADIADLIDHLDVERVHLVGHDWGGAVVWAAAPSLVDRLHTLTVLNCPPLRMLQRTIFTNPRQFFRSWYVFFFQIPWLPETLMRLTPRRTAVNIFRGSAFNKTPFTDADLAPFVRQFEDRGVPGINYYRANRSPAPPPDMIKTPTRLIWGLQDEALGPWFATSENYREYAETFDRVLIEDAGHWVQEEAAEEVNAALHAHWTKAPPTG